MKLSISLPGLRLYPRFLFRKARYLIGLIFIIGSSNMLKGTDYSSWPDPNIIHFLSQMVSSGHITYHFDGRIYRLEASENAVAQDLTSALDLLGSSGPDYTVNLSPNGEWIIFETERFDARCDGWSCLAVIKSDLSMGDAIIVDTDVIHADGFSSISSDGNTIVYPASGPIHDLDLWVITKEAEQWSTPVLLTGDSLFPFNQQPAISGDGTTVLFSAGPVPYAQEGTGICEVNSDGTGFQVLVLPQDGPGGTVDNAAISPDYAPDGTIVFEADWAGEQVWRFDRNSTALQIVNAAYGNDNSPCVLPDGRIISLWLERPGGSGFHEIKVMNADGSEDVLILTDQDIADIGIGCGG